MKYIVADFKINCSKDIFETARDLLISISGEALFEAFEEYDKGVLGYIPQNLFNKEILDAELKSFPLSEVEISYTINDIEDKNWNSNWEENGFEPINIDGKCVIYDAKHTNIENLNKDTINILIEAKQAFGTGTHQTTRMVISEMLKRDLTGRKILDCGCGTGILGIVASKLGAEHIIGYDIDEWSVNNANHNANLNKTNNITIYHGNADILNNINEKFDIIVANINRNIIISDITKYCHMMKDNATLILSGFYETDINIIKTTAAEQNLHEQSLKTEDDWACIVLNKAILP